MRLLDSRRLTGANVLWQYPGAVIDVTFGDTTPELVVGAWQREVRRLLDEVGWAEENFCVRHFDGGASLAISAPVDALYAATDLNEAAWAAVRDLVEGGHRHLLQHIARQCRQNIREEERPRLRRLLNAARPRNIPVVLDTTQVSLGLGAHSQSWDLAELPHPDEVCWEELAAIPVALVTGTNGKTTTVRLMAAIGRAASLVTGVSSTDWIAVGDEIIDRDDYAGPQGARAILRDRRCELAILETARGGLLRRGLAVERADAALITNIAADHIGEFGVQNLEQLAEVKWVVSRALGEAGTLVLNAEDSRLVALAIGARSPVIWFGLDPANPVLRDHLRSGGTICTIRRARLVIQNADGQTPIVAISKVPICLGGVARHNIANALGATALAHALGIPVAAIGAGLQALRVADNPGRANLFHIEGATFLLDFAHNPHGLAAVIELAGNIKANRRLLVIGQAGDRSDGDIRELAQAASSLRFDKILLKRQDQQARGRPSGEVARLLRREFRGQGYTAAQLPIHTSELTALRAALRWATPGDLVVFLAHENREAVREQLTRRQQPDDTAAQNPEHKMPC